MTTYAGIAQALRSAGYLSDADLDAVIAVLVDALVIKETEEIETGALVDEAGQKEAVLDAEALADAATVVGDVDTEAEAQAAMEDAFIAMTSDEELIKKVEALVTATCTDAVTALVTAELVDETNAEAAIVLIINLWLDDDEE